MKFVKGVLTGFVGCLVVVGYIVERDFISREFVVKNKVCINKDIAVLK